MLSGLQVTLNRYLDVKTVDVPVFPIANGNFSLDGQMLLIPNFPNCVFSFWVGMPFSTQNRILELCVGCPTVDTITVFRDRKWNTPDAVLETLEGLGRVGSDKWTLLQQLPTCMFSSGAKHTAWIFRRL
mmetsp:Transcript_48547/g.101439  ORF Transcript_48547/g.101439 Transcript_48547/m.101439 type:complete len:129 (+) Transcript_48547:1117-1503(+)